MLRQLTGTKFLPQQSMWPLMRLPLTPGMMNQALPLVTQGKAAVKVTPHIITLPPHHWLQTWNNMSLCKLPTRQLDWISRTRKSLLGRNTTSSWDWKRFLVDGPLRDFPSPHKRLLITLTECWLAVAGRPMQHVQCLRSHFPPSDWLLNFLPCCWQAIRRKKWLPSSGRFWPTPPRSFMTTTQCTFYAPIIGFSPSTRNCCTHRHGTMQRWLVKRTGLAVDWQGYLHILGHQKYMEAICVWYQISWLDIGGMCYADTLQVWFPAHWAPWSFANSSERRMSAELPILHGWIKADWIQPPLESYLAMFPTLKQGVIAGARCLSLGDHQGREDTSLRVPSQWTFYGRLVFSGLCFAHSVARCLHDGDQQSAQGGWLRLSSHAEEVRSTWYVGQCSPAVAAIAAAPWGNWAGMVFGGGERGEALYQQVQSTWGWYEGWSQDWCVENLVDQQGPSMAATSAWSPIAVSLWGRNPYVHLWPGPRGRACYIGTVSWKSARCVN